MPENETIVYGWITKEKPLIIVICNNEEKIKACKEQAEAQADREVMFFKYNGVCVSCPGESSLGYTQEHSNQITKFVKLMLNQWNVFPDCVFNDAEAKVV